MKIVHISDIHWRGLSRHDEYKESFLDFFDQTAELNPDVIYVGGDIVHSKTQGISPELIDCLSWWFTELAKIAPTHVILGNHDGLMYNKDRQDAITPILSALNNPRIHLYKESGVYPTGMAGFNWCIFSCFDEGSWEKVIPISGEINLALLHGAVWGSTTDIDWEIEGDVTVDIFENFDFGLLGDIHRRQFLNEKKTIAYPGSPIQQNYGEDLGKGFLFWDIRTKDDFDVKFYEIFHSKPFITVTWQGDVESTLTICNQYVDGARFRIKSDRVITQVDMKQIQIELLKGKDATEVVFKTETSFDASKIKTAQGIIKKEDLRDPSVHKRLIAQYYKDLEMEPEVATQFNFFIDSYLSRISSRDTVLRNIRWNINKLEFDNTFSYGDGNVINFDNLPGIIGIFGKNTKGKSSIIGSLMYGLFNTTDRGPIKNLHIINNRKNFCRAAIEISLGGEKFQIERCTIKNQTRKGDVYGTTSLSLQRIDSSGNVLEDLSGEQRRQTEKTVREMIGTSEDFLMTSLASQGQMNNFIRERATARKMILTNFLDLGVFEKMHDIAKEESSELRHEIKRIPSLDWDAEIDDQKLKIQDIDEKIGEITSSLKRKRGVLQDLKVSLATSSDVDFVTLEEIEIQRKKLRLSNRRLATRQKERVAIQSNAISLEEKKNKISLVKKDFPINEIRQKLLSQSELEKSLLGIRHEHLNHKEDLDRKLKSVEKLSKVPCGDKFPTCMFIKESHKNKTKIKSQMLRVENTLEKLKSIDELLDVVKREKLSEKITKYEKLIENESKIQGQSSEMKIEMNNIDNIISLLTHEIAFEKESLDDLESKVLLDPSDSEIINIKESIRSLDEEIEKVETQKLKYADKKTRAKVEISRLRRERQKFEKIRMDLKIYDMFMQAVSKKGIPLQIMMSQLPLINSEIAKILQGVAGFTVELDADMDSNAMDIYINYGDSKRIIELASGMEKMMASLALRVALINVSSLPKTNVLIIDEGFGSLDESNIEACGRLLISLKKWFKNIILISHVDSVKDSVDNLLEISKKEKDAKVRHI